MMTPVTNGVSTYNWARRQGCLRCTVENCADGLSGESGLLLEVLTVWHLWCVRIIRPRILLRAGHGLGACEE